MAPNVWQRAALSLGPLRVGSAVLEARRVLVEYVPAGWVVVLGDSFAMYAALGWYLTVALDLLHDDAMSRTALASFVLRGAEPQLAAIGFVWNPLPSLVQIPLVPMLRPYDLQALAGPFQSAASMAGASALLWKHLGLFRLGHLTRTALLALFVTNPMILLYAANGLSEAMFLFCMVWTSYAFVLWVRNWDYAALIGMALATAASFGARYEALPLTVAGAIALVPAGLKDGKLDASRLEAVLIAYLAPIVHVVFLWLFLNQLIVGDALYFQRSVYSNTAQTAAFRESGGYLSGVVGSPLGAARYAGERLFGLSPVFGIILAFTALQVVRRRDWRLGCLAGIWLSVPTFHLVLVHGGNSYGWLRFFMYGIPASFVLAPLLLSHLGRRDRRLAIAALILVSSASSGAALWLMTQPDVAREEHPFVRRVLGLEVVSGATFTHGAERAIAEYVDELPEGRILIDTSTGFSIVLLARQPARFVITSDRDFNATLDGPVGQIAYLLVPRAERAYGGNELVNGRYPELYGGGMTWAKLERDFGDDRGWRLFRVDDGS